MDSPKDNQWASRYLLDPLTAPEPNAETGPGTHYNSTYSPQTTTSARSERNQNTPSTSVRSSSPLSAQKFTPSATSNNPYRNGSTSYPSPPRSASSRSGRFSGHRPDVIPASEASSQIPTSTGGGASTTTGGHRHRTSSLNQRFSGDQSHRPLDMIMQDAKHAHRHPNLRKRNQVGADSIDLLDNITRYHHEGPFDATLLARNQSYANSPVEAVRTSNEEALRATPKEMIKDSIDKHRPLDGVAMVPPGMEDRDGNVYNYNEGTNMMIENGPEGGAYKRWPGVQYHPDDLKGKGEPSFSIEKALKQHKAQTRNVSDGNNAIEMTNPTPQTRPLGVEGQFRPVSDGQNNTDCGGGVRRTSSGAVKLRRRIGTLRIGK